jgi:hypothetical protein
MCPSSNHYSGEQGLMGILGPATGYVDMLDEATVAAAKAEQAAPRKFNPLRPSSAGKCTRELAYEYMEFTGRASYPKEDTTANQQRIFGLGHYIETHGLNEFKKHVPGFEQKYKQQILEFFRLEAKNHPELSHTVEGSLDTCFWSPSTRGVADFKSKKDKYSSYFSSNWDETTNKLRKMATVTTVSDTFFWVEDLPTFLRELNDVWFEMNFVQLNGYACTPFLQSRGVDHASIIQYNKNDSRMREVRFKPSMVMYEALRKKFQTAVDAVDASDPTLAPRDHALGSMKCRFCPFKTECWEGKDAKKAFFDTMPKKSWPTDTSRLGDYGKQLDTLIESYEGRQTEGERKATEGDILKIMTAVETQKVRAANGSVYESKYLKSPYPRFELRKSKA